MGIINTFFLWLAGIALSMALLIVVGSVLSTWFGQVAYTVTICIIKAVQDGQNDVRKTPHGAAKHKESEG